MHWGALIAGVAFGAAALAVFPEVGWELGRLRRLRRLRKRGGWL